MTITEMFTSGDPIMAVKATLYSLGIPVGVVLAIGACVLVGCLLARLHKRLREIKSFQQLLALLEQIKKGVGQFVSARWIAICRFFQNAWWNYLDWKDALWQNIKRHRFVILCCVGGLIAIASPFGLLAFTFKMPWVSILVMAAVGAALGMLCSPFIGWHFRRKGFLKAAVVPLLSIPAGAWVSCMTIAYLFMMASD